MCYYKMYFVVKPQNVMPPESICFYGNLCTKCLPGTL